MLQNIRENAQGTIAKTIIVLLILSLSVWGLDSLVGGSGETSVATVNGEPITEREFERTVRLRRQQRLQQMETPDPTQIDMDALNEEVMDQLIREELVSQDIAARGLDLSDRDIDRMITQAEQFQVDGTFSQERFTRAVRNQGMTVQAFRRMIEEDHLTRILQAVVEGSAFSTKTESERIARLLNQTRDFDVLDVPLSAVEDDISITDEDIQRFYDDHKGEFRQQEAADVAWITLEQDGLVDPSSIEEARVRERYDQHIETMNMTEKRNPAHILIKDDPERVEAVRQALDNGKAFADLAETYSDDSSSAVDGGELGLSGRNAFAEPFADALFSIEEVGGVAGPVETSFGTHFIRLLDVEVQDPPTFEAMEAQLRREIARERASTRFAQLSEELADIAYSEYDLKKPSELINAEIQTRERVQRNGAEPPFDNPALRRQLFTEDVREGGFNTELVEIGPGKAVVARVREYYPEKQKALSSVREQVRERLMESKAREALRRRLTDDADSGSVAAAFEQEWQTYREAERSGADLTSELSEAIFNLPRPPKDGVTTEVVELPESMALIRLHKVNLGEGDASEMMASNIQPQLARRHGQSAYFYYLEQLRASADISRD